MIIKLTNFDPEYMVYLTAERICSFQRQPQSKQTQIITDVATGQGPVCYSVLESPDEIMKLLERSFH